VAPRERGALKVSDGPSAESRAGPERGRPRRRESGGESLRAQDELLRLLLDATAEGIYATDLQGRCTFCNVAGLRMLGFAGPDELLGRHIHGLIHSTRRDGNPCADAACPISRVFRTRRPVHVRSDVFWRADGTRLFVEYRARPVRRDGRVAGCVVTFLDIAERKRAAERVRVLSRLVEQAADSICITDPQGIIEYVNRAFLKLTGFSRSEAVGRRPSLVQSGAHDRAFYARVWGTVLSGKVFRGVFLNRRKDGRLYYEDQAISPIVGPDGAVSHLVAVGRDISERIGMEQRLQATSAQLRKLAAHLESVREEERARISREIHDELGQILTGLKIDLFALAAREEAPALARRVRAACGLVDAAIGSVGRIAAELRPPGLDDDDLPAAVEALARSFRGRTGIACEVETPPGELRLPAGVVLTLFRICQDALTNIARHAGATQVILRLECSGGWLNVEIEDNGRGLASLTPTGKSIGLVSMAERAREFGGSLASRPGAAGGTCLILHLPMEEH